MFMDRGSQNEGKGRWQWMAVLALITVSALALGPSAVNLIERWTSTEATSTDNPRPDITDVPSDTGNGGLSDRMSKPMHYDTGDSSERIKTLPVPTAADETHKRVIYSLAIPDLSPGDILQVTSEFQVTNDLGYNVMCVSQIILADSETAVAGIEITEANGRNVTPAAHHDTFPKVGSLTVTTPDRKYVNLVAWCASTRATTGSTITVDADYGRLSIIRY